MMNLAQYSDSVVIPCGFFVHQRPVVVIEQNLKNLTSLIEQYLGQVDIILVPNQYHGLHMIQMIKAENIEILAVIGIHADAGILPKQTPQ